MKRSDSPRAKTLLGILFFTLGIIALIGGIASYYFANRTIQSYVQTQATIVGMWNEHTIVSYQVDGEDVTAELSATSSTWRVGDSLTVYYDPHQPTKVTTDMVGWLVPLILGTLGGIFTIIGVCFLVACLRMARHRRTLMEEGMPLHAEVTDICTNYSLRIGNRHPVLLQCSCTGTDGKKHVYQSYNVWTRLDRSVIGQSVTVYVDRNDMNRFYVDTDSLEGMGNTIYHEG